MRALWNEHPRIAFAYVAACVLMVLLLAACVASWG